MSLDSMPAPHIFEQLKALPEAERYAVWSFLDHEWCIGCCQRSAECTCPPLSVHPDAAEAGRVGAVVAGLPPLSVVRGRPASASWEWRREKNLEMEFAEDALVLFLGTLPGDESHCVVATETLRVVFTLHPSEFQPVSAVELTGDILLAARNMQRIWGVPGKHPRLSFLRIQEGRGEADWPIQRPGDQDLLYLGQPASGGNSWIACMWTEGTPHLRHDLDRFRVVDPDED